jgi:hypothetical protein
MKERTRRIFGGAEAQVSGRYERPLLNPSNQDTAEQLAVGTHYRMFPGPRGVGGSWSYHINPTAAAGAASELSFMYSNLPSPDPTNAAHWLDSGITPIDLTATTDTFATVTGKAPVWICAKAVIAVSAGSLWAYVRSEGVEE